MTKHSTVLGYLHKTTSGRFFVLALPLVIVAIFGFIFAYHKQLSYQHFIESQNKPVVPSTSLPLKTTTSTPINKLGVSSSNSSQSLDTATDSIQGSTSPSQTASSSLQTNVKSTSNSLNTGSISSTSSKSPASSNSTSIIIPKTSTASPLQTNVNINDQSLINNPLVQSILSQLP